MAIACVRPLVFAAALASAAGLGTASAQTGGAPGGGSSAGAPASGSLSTPTYSARPPAGTAASGGTVGATQGNPEDGVRKYPEHAGRTIRCPDGSIGKTDAGGCLGGL